jgi:hypothetical protein
MRKRLATSGLLEVLADSGGSTPLQGPNDVLPDAVTTRRGGSNGLVVSRKPRRGITRCIDTRTANSRERYD